MVDTLNSTVDDAPNFELSFNRTSRTNPFYFIGSQSHPVGYLRLSNSLELLSLLPQVPSTLLSL